MKMKKLWMVAALLTLCGNMTVLGEESEEQFSIATLNVDGLPHRVMEVNTNPNGPGDAGSARIGKYLLQKGYDLVMMQEDFNYHGVISVLLEDDYRLDEWTGDVGLEGHKIDFLHLQNHRFECDGLMACWKNDLLVTPAPRTAWKQSFGKFSHANDEMVTKGFRRYDVTLRGGQRIVVYNAHMDASDINDRMEQKDAKDKAARIAQWEQLKEDVLLQLDTRPIIIVGDMNSLYGYDDMQEAFVDAINETGRGTISDVWKELQQENETYDKILYINPATGTKIEPVAFTLDTVGYRYEGRPLGDHYPVSATFRVVPRTITGTVQLSDANSQDAVSEYYNLNGQRATQPKRGIYVEQRKGKTDKIIVK